ncbi:MAG: glycosyltransferase [Myxococcales bacterium]|nr:MAG: glycosyltransferase [Myxococcales bacterium]
MKVLLVTKPLVPPWDDSAKNLARDIVQSLPDVRFNVLTTAGCSFGLKHVREEPLYGAPGGYAPPLWNNVKVFLRLLKPDEMGLYHFFFAPNPRASLVAGLAMAMKGYQRSVQTVCSAPKSFEGVARLLFADVAVAVSAHTRDRLREAGVKDARLIYPAVARVETPTADEILASRRRFGLPEDKTLALYAGDLEFSNAASTLVAALPEACRASSLHVVFCNRWKTPAARAERDRLQAEVKRMGLASRVVFLPPQTDLQPLLRGVDFWLMHPDTLYAKMDLPLVVLEAMGHGKPGILSDRPPLVEAFAGETAGILAPPGDAAALANAMRALAEDAALRERCGRTAQAVARERFSFDRLAEAHRALYAEFQK